MAKILVVDDDVVVATLLRRVLECDGHEVRVARDGQEGLDIVAEAQPDFLVLDLDMPRLSGLDVCYHPRGTPIKSAITRLPWVKRWA